MIFPLEELIKYQGNMYEITCAASRRSYQLSKLGGAEVEDNNGKVVSLAARQIFTGKVKFMFPQNKEKTAIPSY
ncbi:MAG: DNA-directed RNA polymerase subunit omega [Spirochaetaceae bacterium]|jgi:DNA-directed RNA polymerase subunit omega|nr:DNA-directed RNA polymerase subunit omega [Spirochaetaceae bacterium]